MKSKSAVAIDMAKADTRILYLAAAECLRRGLKDCEWDGPAVLTGAPFIRGAQHEDLSHA